MAPPSDSSTTTPPKPRDEPKQPPPITSIARDGFICIKVGPSLKSTYVHKTLLCHHSEYFRNALKAPWKEAEDKTITLIDINPIIFDIFVGWLYTGKIPENWNAVTTLEVAAGDTVAKRTDDKYVTSMAMAYIFGDRFLSPLFQRAVLDQLIRRTNLYSAPSWFHGISLAFESLPKESQMLHALVDIQCRYWDRERADGLNINVEEYSKLLPASFWLRVVDKTAAKIKGKDHEWWNKKLDPCDYHEHGTTEEREECAKKKA